ncbi:MAG: transporter substrate-binding domain-containing protein [Pseudomonadales bacterium]|nr:transporter substrate-binding domain-containing protein [Pseudomonadales bacterium]
MQNLKTLFSGCILVLSCQTMADTISLRADSWYPFNASPESKKPGYMIEIASMAWQEAGHKVDYQLMDWDKSLAQVNSGETDCIVGVLKSEAPDLIFPKLDMGSSDIAFFAKFLKYNWKFNGVQSFESMRIGVVEDYSYSTEIDQYVRKHADTNKVVIAKGEQPLSDLIHLLEAEKIDLVLENPAVFKAQARKMQSSLRYERLDMLGDAESLYIACSGKK